jgi:serpin B
MEEADVRPSKKARRLGAGSGLTLFALRLAKELSEGGSSGDNFVFSLLSIYDALSLVAAGAGSKTLDEFLALLNAASCDELAEFIRAMAESALADRSVSGGPLIAFASRVWHQETLALRPAYRAAAVESYKAKTRAADFLEKVS